MSDEMTPAQARRALSNLLDEYDGTLLHGVATDQQQFNRIPDVDDRERFRSIVGVLETDEITRKALGPMADDSRGVEETTAGTRSIQDAARTGPFPVEMSVAIVGQPGDRQLEITSEERSIGSIHDPTIRDTLAQRHAGDPVDSFRTALAERVRSAVGASLDQSEVTGDVGTVRIRSDGTFTFEQSVTDSGFARQSSGGRRPGDTQPTTQRPDRGQQTLSEAGTREGLDRFATGTVEDDPDEVIGPADEVRRQHRAATTGGERTAGRGEGLGQFARIVGQIRATLQQDPPTQVPDEDGNVVERPGTRTINPWITFPGGHSADFNLRGAVERAVFQQADVDGMFDLHETGTTITIGQVEFVDGGNTVESVRMNDNYVGDPVTVRAIEDAHDPRTL